MTIGIYRIRNIINNKSYIGSSIRNIHKRCVAHRRLLNRQQHVNSYLQNAWDKYGQSSFEFSIIEECSKDMVLIREDFWMDYYDSMNRLKGYNLVEAENHVPSEETRKKMSNSHMGKTLSEETKKRMSEAKIGVKKSEETLKNMSLAHMGEKHSPERLIIDSECHKGIIPSEETRKKMSEA